MSSRTLSYPQTLYYYEANVDNRYQCFLTFAKNTTAENFRTATVDDVLDMLCATDTIYRSPLTLSDGVYVWEDCINIDSMESSYICSNGFYKKVSHNI